MAHQRAPKQWQLTRNETINSYENWRQNLTYILSLDQNFAQFLENDFTWLKKTAAAPNRGLTNDGEGVPENRRKTAVQKNIQLELMLGQIANFCPVISRNSIIKNSTSLTDIWQKIRQHYGFQSTGSHFLDIGDIKLQPGERPEDLFQRLMAFVEDTLLTTTCNIRHHGQAITVDEDLTPTMENMIVLLWLQLVHPGLPSLVKQKYGAELRNQTLASLKPEISQALSSLLDELRGIEDSKAFRAFTPNRFRSATREKKPPVKVKQCILCKTAGRSSFNTHSLRYCRFLPESDRGAFYGTSRLVPEGDEDDLHFEDDEDDGMDTVEDTNLLLDQPSIKRVDVEPSPYLNSFYGSHPVRLTLDSGATTNMVRSSFASAIKLPVTKATQRARQADGITPLEVIGEIHCMLSRGDIEFQLDALVVKQLDVDVLAGNPFLKVNDVAVRPAKNQIVIGGTKVVYYGQQSDRGASIRRTQAFVLRAAKQTTIFPGGHIDVKVPDDTPSDQHWALEPRLDSPCNAGLSYSKVWPPCQDIESVGHVIRVTNSTDSEITLKTHEHFCQVRPVTVSDAINEHAPSPVKQTSPHQNKPYSQNVTIDPDSNLSEGIRQKFVSLHAEYDDVFNPSVSKYNGASGDIKAVVNMGPTLPPQRKGRLPHYNKDMLNELQDTQEE